MHALLGTFFIVTSAIYFGLALLLLRKTRIGTGGFSEPVSTFLALTWTLLTAFALAEVTQFGLDWKIELGTLGASVLAGLGATCVAAFAATGWLVRRAH
ncbi:hypothetical protein [Roseibium sp. M-1]